MMKQRLSLYLLAAALLLAMAGCAVSGGNGEVPDGDRQPPHETIRPDEAPETPAPSAPAEEPEQTEEPMPPETDYAGVYNEILDGVYRHITEGYGWDEEFEGEFGIRELANWMTADEALQSVGYAVMDISGDGIPELLLGTVPGGANPGEDMVFSAFTCREVGQRGAGPYWMGGGDAVRQRRLS